MAAGTYLRPDFMVRVIEPFNARRQQHLIPSLRHLYADADGDTVSAMFDSLSFDEMWTRVKLDQGR